MVISTNRWVVPAFIVRRWRPLSEKGDRGSHTGVDGGKKRKKESYEYLQSHIIMLVHVCYAL